MTGESNARDGQVKRVVLQTGIAASVVAAAIDLTLNSGSSPSLIRSVIYLGFAALALAQALRPSNAQLRHIFLAAVFGGMSLLDSVSGSNLSLIGPGVTLALLILLSIVYATLRDQHSKEPIVAFAAGTSAFTVATVLFGDYSATHTLGFLLVGVLGQTLVLWIVFRLIETLGTASATEAKHARIHEALAHCSQALLNRGTPAPLTTALKALLDATDADYAYVDVTRIDRDGHYTWEIVADAMGADYPGDESAFVSGDYSEQEDILASLLEGQPARVITSELAGPLKDRYEDEGIRAELIAPIMIGERFTGTIGYTDHIREGSWTDIEVKALMRAAEMVAAYWEREAAREGLMELAQAKDRFIAAVSHELRTPLAAVVGFSGALAQGTAEYSPAELSEMTTTIYNQSLELTHLVDDLLTSERAASGNLTVRAVDIDLMAECRDLARSTVSDSKVDVLGDDSVIAHADSLRTRQIIRNLLTNAVRYGGGSIEIHVEPGPSIARVTVKDNGRGVSNIDADRIFDPYYRTQEGLTTPDSVGLGLAVARQLARLMEGDVVYRRTNGWTEFEFTLPLATHESTVAPILADTLSGNGHMSDGSDPRETVTVAVSPEESTDN